MGFQRGNADTLSLKFWLCELQAFRRCRVVLLAAECDAAHVGRVPKMIRPGLWVLPKSAKRAIN